MAAFVRWALGGALVVLLVAGPLLYYRASYAHAKRLREVEPGRFYRSGQLTQAGFAEAIRRYGIRTVINLQNESPDPPVKGTLFDRQSRPESAVCADLGVRYLFLSPELIEPARVPAERPEAIDEFLKILDDPSVYPVLIHCKAGLHRTGLLTGVYRMEYQGWSRAAAIRELKANGFGEFVCSSDNEYVVQYLLTYQPRSGGIRK